MRLLGAMKFNRIMVETGAKLNASLLAANVVDEFVIYLAPSILGNDARGMFALPELLNLRDKVALTISDVRQVGADLKITARVGGHSSGHP